MTDAAARLPVGDPPPRVCEIVLCHNPNGGSIRVTGPALVRAPQEQWTLVAGEAAYFDSRPDGPAESGRTKWVRSMA